MIQREQVEKRLTALKRAQKAMGKFPAYDPYKVAIHELEQLLNPPGTQQSRYSDKLGPNYASAWPGCTLQEVAKHTDSHWLQCIPAGDDWGEGTPIVIVLKDGTRLESMTDRCPEDRSVSIEEIEAVDIVDHVEVEP